MGSDRASTRACLALLGWWGYAAGINGAAAPLLSTSFGVADPALASALGWIGLASLCALALGRLADRVGRRAIVLVASGLLPFAAAASACASTLAGYVAAQMAVYACGTTLLATLVVLVSEQEAPAQRARAQARAGGAYLAGTALPLVACALFAPDPLRQAERWRWLWWSAAMPVALWPLLLRSLRDAPAWRAGAGRPADPAAAEDRSAAGRGGHAPILACAAALIATAEVASRSWLFFHAVASLGIAPRRALVVIATGGAASFLGFGGGARVADRYGRRVAFLAAGALFALGAAGYFGASLGVAGDPTRLLLVSLAAMGIGGNAATITFRAHATELTPLRRRGRLAGSLAVANAVGWVVAMFSTGALARASGSLGFAVTALVGLSVPSAIALVLCLPETSDGGRGADRGAWPELDAAA